MSALGTPEQRAAYVDARMKAIGKTRVQKAQLVAAENKDAVSGALLIAISLRESGGRNVLGDHGHARGAFQITDWFHKAWLKSVRGCLAAKLIPEATRLNWIPIPGANAAMPGMAPTWEDGARYTADLIMELWYQARDAGVPEEDRLEVAVGAFNCGFRAAYRGYLEGNVDNSTTGGDYVRDVLMRRSEVTRWLNRHVNWRA